jgi:aspartate-semialdehyde dehydrogenase
VTAERTPVAVLGAGGLVGQQFVRLLDRHPSFEVRRLTGRGRSSARRLEQLWRVSAAPPAEIAAMPLRPDTPADLVRAGIRIAFSALPSGTAGPIEAALRRKGIQVFSNAADHRLAPGVPLVVPEVNPARLTSPAGAGGARIVTNPNCTTTGLVLALAPVWRELRPRAVHVASYQALSGAGASALDDPRLRDTVVPHIPHEEEKVAREAAELLRELGSPQGAAPTTRLLAQCARVPVSVGHLEAITVEARRRPSLARLDRAWRDFDPLATMRLPTAPHPPVIARREPDRPQPGLDRWAGAPRRARGMAVSVGRVRWEGPYLRLFALVHNTVRGAAGGSLLNAELALAYGLLDGAPPKGR